MKPDSPSARGGGGAAPVRLRLSRAKGFDLQAHSRAVNGLSAISVARPHIAGNPWAIRGAREAGYQGTDRQLAAMCSRYFAEWVKEDVGSLTRMLKGGEALLARLKAQHERIRGCNVACFCDLPEPGENDVCHGCVVIDWANADDPGRAALAWGRGGGDGGDDVD